MPKFKTIIKVIISALIIGFIMSVLIHTQNWNKLMVSLKTFNVFLYIFLPFIFFFIAILIHELSHLISFVINKVRIRAIFVLIFGVYKNKDSKWRFVIVPKNIKMLGGFVVPNFETIGSEEKFETLKHKFSKALLAGPVGSLIYCLIVVIFFLLSWFLTSNSFLIAFSFLNALITIIMTFLVFVSSKLSTDQFYGDFVAYKKFETDKRFVLTQIDQYVMFSLYDSTETDKFLFEKITNYYLEVNRVQYTIFDYSLLSSHIGYNIDQDVLDLRLDSLIEKYDVTYLSKINGGLELSLLICSYYYSKGNVEKAYNLFFQIKDNDNKHYSIEDKEFVIKEYEHYLNLANNESYFIENQNIVKKNYELFLPIMDIDEIIRKKKHTLPFVKYYCEYSPLKDEEEELK